MLQHSFNGGKLENAEYLTASHSISGSLLIMDCSKLQWKIGGWLPDQTLHSALPPRPRLCTAVGDGHHSWELE